MSTTTHPRRSLAKAICWRAIEVVDTFVISYLITGRTVLAGSIVGIEAVTKLVLYYVHERAWERVPWGRR